MENLRIVIAGGGRVGYRSAQAFAARGSFVTVIERDPEFAGRIQGVDRLTAVQGDATDPNVLQQAITSDTDVVAALTSDGETNLAVVLAAERLVADGTRLVARVGLELPDAYHDLVDDIRVFGQSSVRAAVAAMGGHDLRGLEESTDILEFHTLRVGSDAPVAGVRLADADLPDGCLVISTVGGQHSADGETVLRAGHEYVVAVEEGVAGTVRELFTGA